jgi:hypothetical protein
VKLERGGANGVSPFEEEEGYEARLKPRTSPFDPSAVTDEESGSDQ